MPKIISHLGEEASADADPEAHTEAATDAKMSGSDSDIYLKKVPDAELLANLFQECDRESEIEGKDGKESSKGDPRTLHQVLAHIEQPYQQPEIFDQIWRLIMFCRYWHKGGDHHWINNPRACRIKSKKLNWHQCLAF